MITHSFHAGHLRLACNLFHSIDFDYTCDILRGIPPFNPWMLRELSKVPLKLDPNVPGPFLISQPKISSGITSVRKPDPASFNFRARIICTAAQRDLRLMEWPGKKYRVWVLVVWAGLSFLFFSALRLNSVNANIWIVGCYARQESKSTILQKKKSGGSGILIVLTVSHCLARNYLQRRKFWLEIFEKCYEFLYKAITVSIWGR